MLSKTHQFIRLNKLSRVPSMGYSATIPQHENFMPATEIENYLKSENPLVKVIQQEITEKGPMNYQRYFDMALTHPQYGLLIRILHEPECV